MVDCMNFEKQNVKLYINRAQFETQVKRKLFSIKTS